MKKSLLFLLGQLCLFHSISVAGLAQVQPQIPATDASKGVGTISGVLIDSVSGKPVEYATVALLKKGTTHAQAGTLTDNGGRFSFSGVAPGDYEVIISFIGYETKTIRGVSVTARNPEAVTGIIKLKPIATQLQEVNVQTLRPTIMQEADRMIINVEGTAMAAGSTAFDVLVKSPGVFIDQEGNIQLNGRSGVTIMLDGKLTYLSSRDLRTLLEGMAAENIKNIEIITNPSAKYDAEGSSGILNINLKKNTQQGINGSLYAGYTYNGKQHGYTTGGNINHKSSNWNSFLNLDMARRVGGREATFTRIFYGETNTTYFDQVATGNYMVQGPPAVRLGTDYSLNDKHSVGFMAHFGTNFLETDFLTDTYIGSRPNQPELFIDANNYLTNQFTNFTSNVHYVGKLDTLGSSLTADIDYVKISNRGKANFYNDYDSLITDAPTIQDFLYTDTPNEFDIYSAKIDFTKSFTKDRKLEVGAKASRVMSDNDSRFYFNNSDVPVLDINRTNHFVYDEDIYAAYINLNSKLGEKFTLQAGLRAEQTHSKGESLTTGQVTERNYLSLFPSFFLQQKITDDYDISYSYSRRIQRPNYGSMNPFITYRDPYTYVQGNPFLRPQFTHAFGITQTFKKTYNLILNYQRINDVISELPILVEETATTIYTTGNVDDAQNISLTAIAPLTIMKNWDTNNTLVLSYNEFSMVANNELIVNDQVFYMLQSNHNILLPIKLKMEANGVYRGPAASGLYRIAPMWWVHIAFKKSFLDDKLDLSLNFNDIFKTYRLVFTTDISGNVNDFDQYFRNRTVGLTLRYNFSRGEKFDSKRRNNSLDELNRTGG
ncbi:TonB-dependent receptor domain-containing protein [Pontibacter pamirensis]|uniref:TonB-dependent receptor domain-containing protein n=1 Tax=Pontibacter pamirensis TaxID=2562824 RepID=UPI001389F0A7|nr:outer membrane beta-barrel family protein [Pontibacter pamirensis]